MTTLRIADLFCGAGGTSMLHMNAHLTSSPDVRENMRRAA